MQESTNDQRALTFLGNDWERLVKKFNYSNYDLAKEKNIKRKDRDIFTHLRDGNRRVIVTNHPQGTPTEIWNEIIRIINEDDWGTAETWKMPI